MRNLYDQLQDADNLDLITGGKPATNKDLQMAIAAIVGNPAFNAEVTFNFSVKYYSQAVVGTPVAVAAAGLPAGQQTKLPLFLFGYNDLAGAYKKAKAAVPVAGWNIADSLLYLGNQQSPVIYPLPHAAAAVGYTLGSVYNNLVDNGDLVLAIPMNGFVAGAAATTIIAEVIIKCANVAYTSLISSLASDTFLINMIRYTVDPALLTQLQNQIAVVNQSIFGRASQDTIDPNAFITPMTYNKNIADMPTSVVINKYVGLALPVNYDSVSFSWTVTIQKINKFRG
jgi:hypothetical protein